VPLPAFKFLLDILNSSLFSPFCICCFRLYAFLDVAKIYYVCPKAGFISLFPSRLVFPLRRLFPHPFLTIYYTPVCCEIASLRIRSYSKYMIHLFFRALSSTFPGVFPNDLTLVQVPLFFFPHFPSSTPTIAYVSRLYRRLT